MSSGMTFRKLIVLSVNLSSPVTKVSKLTVKLFSVRNVRVSNPDPLLFIAPGGTSTHSTTIKITHLDSVQSINHHTKTRKNDRLAMNTKSKKNSEKNQTVVLMDRSCWPLSDNAVLFPFKKQWLNQKSTLELNSDYL